MTTCPQCGGTDRRIVAPGYFECTSESQRLVDVAPAPGHDGPRVAPIYRTFRCGARYQAGGMSVSVAQCWCGMFAVGACSECSDPLCGDHLFRPGGRVLCSSHAPAAIEASRQRAHAEAQAESLRRQQEKADELVEARRAVEREIAARYAAAPGFPTAPAAGPDLAAALDRMVPHKKRQFETRWAKRPKKRRYAEGWMFILNTKPNGELYETEVLVVLADGRMFLDRTWVRDVSRWTPTLTSFNRGGPVTTIEDEHRERVLDQVLHWLGVLEACSIATHDQFRAVKFEGSPPTESAFAAGNEWKARRLALRD